MRHAAPAVSWSRTTWWFVTDLARVALRRLQTLLVPNLEEIAVLLRNEDELAESGRPAVPR
jgi:hypothetical protein